MRMKSRTWLLLRLTFVALLLAGAAVYLLRWPSGWAAIDLGMQRANVVALVGEPTVDGGRVEGQFWVDQRRLARYELWIAFDKTGRVAAFTVDRRLGTAERFHQSRLKGDLSDRIGH
jgi:hypothetical protein